MDYDITLQRQAYLDARGYTILTACPGSGKTTSIVKKLLTVSRYCEEHYGKHTGFACLSFTNKACAELKQKYREMHDERITFPNEVLTIDSFIMQYVVLPFWYLCDECKQRPIVVNEAEILDRIYYNNVKINGKWQQYPVMALRSYTSLMYRKNPSLVSRDKTGFKWNRKTITENEIAYCNAAFTYRLEKGFITSSDALWIACDILERHQSVAKALVMRFPYIIVDEAQDNSELHFELFKLLKRAGLQNIEFVGDICQSIYGFNNARPELLQSMMAEAEWNVLPLSECRRSNQRIINLYSKLKSSDVPTIISHNVEDKGVPIVVFPVTIQIKLDQSFRLNLFLSYLQRIAFLGELLGQRSRHESLRRPLIEPVRRHIVLNTFGSLESRDFRTRKNPSINRFSLAVSSLPHIPY